MRVENNIKVYRKQKNLTQEKLAQKSDLTLRTIQHYELGTRTPDILVLHRIAKVLDVTAADLYPA